MSRVVFYSVIFLFIISVETSFLSAVNFKLYLMPLAPIVGIYLFHQHSSRIGLWYIIGWGIWYDYFGLSPWSVRTVVAVLMVVAVLYSSARVFSHQSLYGLIGTGGVAVVFWTIVEFIFRFFSKAEIDVALSDFVIDQIISAVFLILGLTLLFLLNERLDNGANKKMRL